MWYKNRALHGLSQQFPGLLSILRYVKLLEIRPFV